MYLCEFWKFIFKISLYILNVIAYLETMKIAIFSRWNATCGVSVHAELIGREFIKMGHELLVFAPYLESATKWWHYKKIRSDEEFVIRCYYENDPDTLTEGYIEEEKILGVNFDVLIVESDYPIPQISVEKLISKIKGKVPVILVIHEGSKDKLRYRNLSIFDAIVVFDNRYITEVLRGFSENVHIIPYPCYPPVIKKHRVFMEDVLRFFSFGRQPVDEYEGFINVLSQLEDEFKVNFEYLVVRSNGPLPYRKSWLIQRRGRLLVEDIYKILLNDVDICLIPKKNTRNVVISSTFNLIAGALTPIIAPYTRHFEAIPEIKGIKPIILYNSLAELKSQIIKLVEDEQYRMKIIDAMKVYAEENSCRKIAEKFMQLIKSLF